MVLPLTLLPVVQGGCKVGAKGKAESVPMRTPSLFSKLIVAALACAVLAIPASASAAPGWINGNTEYTWGTTCGGPLVGNTYEQQVGGFTGYWGETDTSYPKIGDRFWGHVYYTATGTGCNFGLHGVQVDVLLPEGTQLAIDPSSSDPNDKIQCARTNINGSVVNVTDVPWQHPGDPSIRGKHCDSTQVSQNQNGIVLAYTLIARGQSMEIIFPLRATKKLSGIAEPGGKSKMMAAIHEGSITTIARPFQWNFVGDRPVEVSCPALGQQTTTNIANTTAHAKGFLCNWYRQGKAQFEIREGTAGTFVAQGTSPEYPVDGQFQGYLMDQDWNNLKPGTDYQWRMKFTDTKGTATTSDDQLHYGPAQTFKTTGAAPPPNTPAPPPGAGTGGTGGSGQMPGQQPGGQTPGGQQPGGQQPGDNNQNPGDQNQTPGDQQQQIVPEVKPPADTVAPSLTATIGKAKLAQILKKGLPVSATCNEGCTVKGELHVDAKTAKKLKLGKKAVVIGSGHAVGSAGGKTTVPVKLTAKARKALKRTRSIKVTVLVTATDPAGNAAKPVKRTLSLKR